MLKTLVHPDTGQTFKMGRLRPAAPAPRLAFGDYVYKSMPPPPDAVDYSQAPDPIAMDILGNGENGNCTIAGAFHIEGVLLANAGQPLPAGLNSANCVSLYYKLTGGQDTGLDEQTVLNYWQSNGLLADGTCKIAGSCAVDATNWQEVCTALWLFENLYFGAEMPTAWLEPFPHSSGFIWDAAGDPDPNNGHCFIGDAYTQGGVKNDTWGLAGVVTPAAIAKYCIPSAYGTLYTVLSQDAINRATQKAPNGFDFPTLRSNLNSVSAQPW